jgi:hypothetical protein
MIIRYLSVILVAIVMLTVGLSFDVNYGTHYIDIAVIVGIITLGVCVKQLVLAQRIY